MNLQQRFPDLLFEAELWSHHYHYIAGVDEAGRGPLAGPLAAAALILPTRLTLLEELSGVRDSKQMTPKQRSFWAPRIKQVAISWGIGFASNQEIDAHGIVFALHLAIRRALHDLSPCPQFLLVDYVSLPEVPIPQHALVKGDSRSLSIAGASVLAKTARDEWMCQFDEEYPGYGFARHKGYGTLAHRRAIQQLGLSPIHRSTFCTSSLR